MEFPPVTQERIQQALTSLGVAFKHDEYGDTAVDLEDLHCYFVINDNSFIARADWLGAATEAEDILALRRLINSLNMAVPWVRIRAHKVNGGVQPQGFILYPLPGGANDEQLSLMLDFFFTGANYMSSYLSKYAGDLKFSAPKNNNEEES